MQTTKMFVGITYVTYINVCNLQHAYTCVHSRPAFSHSIGTSRYLPNGINQAYQ